MSEMKRKGQTSGPAARSRSGARSARAAARSLGRPSIALVLLFAGLILASAFVAIEVQRNGLARDARTYRAELAAAAAYNQQLTADIATKKTDDYVVNRARDYGYVLPGETLIGVQPEATAAAVVASPPTITRVQKWLALFFAPR